MTRQLERERQLKTEKRQDKANEAARLQAALGNEEVTGTEKCAWTKFRKCAVIFTRYF